MMPRHSMIETNAARWLARNSPFCPGDMVQTPAGKEVKAILDGLVRKRCATAEMCDDGPIYSVGQTGGFDARTSY